MSDGARWGRSFPDAKNSYISREPGALPELSFWGRNATDKFIGPKPVRPKLDDIVVTTSLCLGPGGLLVGIDVDEMPRMNRS